MVADAASAVDMEGSATKRAVGGKQPHVLKKENGRSPGGLGGLGGLGAKGAFGIGYGDDGAAGLVKVGVRPGLGVGELPNPSRNANCEGLGFGAFGLGLLGIEELSVGSGEDSLLA